MAFRNCSRHPVRFATTSLACKSEPEVNVRRCFRPLHLPCLPDRAGGGHSWRFDAVHASSTSLACKTELEVVSWCFNTFPPVDRKGLGSPAWTRVPDVEQPTQGITSQYCTAMSFDTRNAIARFIGWF